MILADYKYDIVLEYVVILTNTVSEIDSDVVYCAGKVFVLRTLSLH